MTESKELELVKQYPSFFVDYRGDPQKTCMAWGMAHSDGWQSILSDLCRDIKAECDKDPTITFKFDQIKEKFGTLRVYYSGGNEAIHRLVDQAEQSSGYVCELCGSKEKVRTDYIFGWVRTLCAVCKQAFINERTSK